MGRPDWAESDFLVSFETSSLVDDGWLKRFAVMHRMPTAGSHSTAHIPRSLQ